MVSTRQGTEPVFRLEQTSYQDEIGRIAELMDGPVCQIGARAQVLDGKELTWRARLAAKGFFGADLEPGENVDAVFDICDSLPKIRAALAPALAGQSPRGLICAHLLEHLRRPWDAAANLRDLLAPGGLLFVQVPWVQAFHGFPDDFWRISLSGLFELFGDLEFLDAFHSGGASDVAYRLYRDGNPDFSLEAQQMEARMFQLLLSQEANRNLLAGLEEPRAYLSRGYLPVTVINFLARKPDG